MTIHSFSLYLSNRIQEAQQITIAKLADKTGRSPATIRRTIHQLNDYLTPEKQFIVTESKIINQLTYTEYIQFIQSLTIFDYATSWKERLAFLFCLSMVNGHVNFSKQYEELGISQSTKKKDRPQFIQELAQHALTIQSFRGKGIAILGDEQTLRIQATRMISPLIELNEQNQIIPRQANNPIQQLTYQLIQPLFQHAEKANRLQEFFASEKLSFNYQSTKFIYVYHFLSLHRTKQGFTIQQEPDFPVVVPEYTFYHQTKEDRVFSHLLASLDNNGRPIYSYDPTIQSLSNACIAYVEERILTTFYTKKELQQELEQYLYKCVLRKNFHYDFYDNKLDDVEKEFSFLYQLVEYYCLNNIHETIALNKHQISTITLLFREHVLKNKIAGRNLKKVVIITNSAKEKSDFFSQQLLYHFDTQIVAILNIDEIYKLKLLKFDNLMTFSNRISTILLENGFPNIKVNYYFHATDLEYLTKLGFSSNSHRKLLAQDFVQTIETIPKNDLADYLKQTFPNFFI
ncbi:helix-turn-helix domain-containing protein [Enterococcus saccharolyticus]|uniref:HTH domain-containing protein n=1 Tax=Enterococcus saccharolyticus TaxID=41997 RepID=UPI001E5DB9EA|nr:HTH domain-containing protein [Enterococcus saccharolyticus]MCD5002635.1 helix-turn-helix domain-containing protein [Enterococcus saccharolyticus]